MNVDSFISYGDKETLKNNFAIQCLLFNLDSNFAEKMRNSQSFRNYAELQVLNILDYHEVFRSMLKPVFDTKNKEIYFYTSMPSGPTAIEQVSPTSLPGLSFTKKEIENYSSVSVFDEVDDEGKPLNGVVESTDTLFVKNYFVTDDPGKDENFTEDGTTSFYENVLKNAGENEEIVFVPKNLVYEKIGRFMSEVKFLRKYIVQGEKT